MNLEWLSSFSGLQGLPVLTIIFILVILIFVDIKKGVISFRGKGFEIGIQDKERRVIQRQTTYVHGSIEAVGSRLLHQHPGLDKYRTLWICKCVELEWTRSIHYNHVEDTEGYRLDRFVALRDLVQKKVDNSFFFSEDFEQFLKEHVKEVVYNLVRIRNLA